MFCCGRLVELSEKQEKGKKQHRQHSPSSGAPQNSQLVRKVLWVDSETSIAVSEATRGINTEIRITDSSTLVLCAIFVEGEEDHIQNGRNMNTKRMD